MVDALERLHAALADGGAVVDTQPISAWPPIVGARGRIAELDMSEWARTIGQVDAEIRKAIERGLFEVVAERQIVVPDRYDDVADLVEYTSEWAGTSVSPELRALATTERGRVELLQDVRVRVLVKR